MLQIYIGNGLTACVDDQDFEVLCQFKWHPVRHRNTTYAITSVGGKTVYMHRMVLGVDCPAVDHEDRDGLNNQRHNLRPATRSQNGGNMRTRSSNKLGVKGVSLCKATGRYRASIMVNHKGYNLGRYKTLDEAKEAYAKAAAKHFGEFARTS